MATTLKFEVVGLAFWAYGTRKFEGGAHEIDASKNKKLAQAVKDAADAGVGVRLVK